MGYGDGRGCVVLCLDVDDIGMCILYVDMDVFYVVVEVFDDFMFWGLLFIIGVFDGCLVVLSVLYEV